MGTAVSLLMIAAGAIMVWAVIFWSSWGGFGGTGVRGKDSTIVVER